MGYSNATEPYRPVRDMSREQLLALLQWDASKSGEFTDEQLRVAVENRRHLGRLEGQESKRGEAA